MLCGPSCNLCTRSEAELVQNVVDVHASGSFSNDERITNLAIGEPLREQNGHLALACRQYAQGFVTCPEVPVGDVTLSCGNLAHPR